MPGVPHGRACDACRRQKKKCDCSTPTCSRCLRLGLECIGSGERRYLFKDQKCARRRRPSPQSTKKAADVPASSSLIPLSTVSSASAPLTPSFPQNETQLLAGAFMSTIAPSTNVRFNLAQTYGPFLDFVPQRIGTHVALDTATQALICAHRNVCLGVQATGESLTWYSKAVRALRIALADPNIASGSNTVCTALVLIICQNLNGLTRNDWSSHCEGAVRLLCARLSNRKPLSEFEIAMRSHLQGIMWTQGLWRRELRMNLMLFENLTSGLYNDGGDGKEEIMNKQIQIPRLLTLARAARHSHETSPDSCGILGELYAIYGKFMGFAHYLRSAFTTVTPGSTVSIPTQPYGSCLIIACVCNRVLRGLLEGGQEQPPDNDDDDHRYQLIREAEELVDATLALAREAAKCRPIGAAHMVANCVAAWVCTSDVAKRVQLERVYRDFRLDFSQNTVDEDVLLTSKKMAADLSLVPGP